MNYLIFDIETTEAVGPGALTDLDISVISIYTTKDGEMRSYTVEQFGDMWKYFEEADAIVGYNSEHFDIPILNKYYPGNLEDLKSIDILKYIKDSYGRRVKLDDIAKATLGKKKISHGLKAVDWWKEGKVDDVIKYCEEDVRITKDVFEFAKEKGYLKLKDFNGKDVEIKMNTESWDEKNTSKMTFSMGF